MLARRYAVLAGTEPAYCIADGLIFGHALDTLHARTWHAQAVALGNERTLDVIACPAYLQLSRKERMCGIAAIRHVNSSLAAAVAPTLTDLLERSRGVWRVCQG